MGNRWRQWAFAIEGLKSTDKFVLVALADLCHDLDDKKRPNDTCFPKHETLSRMTQLHERTVARSLERLEAQGYVIGFRRARKNGSQASNTYRLVKHPAGRQLSLSDTLADPADFMPKAPPVTVDKYAEPPTPDQEDGTERPICPGTAPPHIGRRAAPLTDPLTTSGQKKDAAVQPLVSFDVLVKGYDERGLEDINKARKVWDRMKGQRQVRAIKGLPGYNAMLAANPWRNVKALWRWLSEGSFDNWQDSPVATGSEAPSGAPMIKVVVGSPQWDAWVDHDARENADKRAKRSWWVAHCKNHNSKTWIFPSEWPPGYGAGQERSEVQ